MITHFDRDGYHNIALKILKAVSTSMWSIFDDMLIIETFGSHRFSYIEDIREYNGAGAYKNNGFSLNDTDETFFFQKRIYKGCCEAGFKSSTTVAVSAAISAGTRPNLILADVPPLNCKKLSARQ